MWQVKNLTGTYISTHLRGHVRIYSQPTLLNPVRQFHNYRYNQELKPQHECRILEAPTVPILLQEAGEPYYQTKSHP